MGYIVGACHGGGAAQLTLGRCSVEPARSASDRRSPVVDGAARKTLMSLVSVNHFALARDSRTTRSRSRVGHPARRPLRIAAAAAGTVSNRFTKIGLCRPRSIAAVSRANVAGRGVLSPRSYAATFVSEVPIAYATCRPVSPADRRRSRISHPCTRHTYQLSATQLGRTRASAAGSRKGRVRTPSTLNV
jgi:hypothetical protein